MNILVINLTRFGDLLQTQPVLHALKAQGHRVGLVCLKNFAPATALLQDVDYVAVLPGGLFLADMDVDWRKALTSVQSFVEDIQRDFPVEGILNTTATLSARLLTRRLLTGSLPPSGDAVPVWGFALDEDGFGCNGNVWTTFLQGSTVRRLNCPFNIVDMFRMAAGCGDTIACNRLRNPEPAVQEAAQALLQAKAGQTPAAVAGAGAADREEKSAGYVSFQLGASEARRQWPVEYFARLGEKLWTELRLRPLLLGAASERPLAEAYAAAARSPFVDCVGETDIPQLAALLRCTKLLVTNDTGTMHLAAGLDIPVLAIFLATAQAWDTGPYRDDCCCLEPALDCHPCAFDKVCTHDNACLRVVRPETVGELVCSRIRTGQWCATKSDDAPKSDGAAPETDGARVWISGRDAHGFAHLSCVSQHGGEDRSLWLELQRHFYRHILDAMDASAQTVEIQKFSLPPVALGQGLSAPFRDAVYTALRQAEALLLLLTEQGLMVQQVPGPLPGQRLLATCNRVRSLFEQCVPLCALGHLWTVIVQERGGDLQAIIRMARILQCALGQWRAYLETDAPV